MCKCPEVRVYLWSSRTASSPLGRVTKGEVQEPQCWDEDRVDPVTQTFSESHGYHHYECNDVTSVSLFLPGAQASWKDGNCHHSQDLPR